jgi:hypothetical protein
MAKWRNLALVILCALTLLTPSLAEARAGGSFGGRGLSYGSQGSFGSRTFNFNGGQPIGRSMTPYADPAAPYYGNRYGSGYGYGYGHPFLYGLGGAFFGSWLGSWLFPHWGYGMGIFPVFGSLFSWIFILIALSMVFRLFRRGYGPMTSPPLGGAGGVAGSSYGYGPAPVATRAITVSQADYAAFEAILKAVQGAWSARDLRTLSHYVTPEMLSYFSEDLAKNQSQGVENRVENVELIRGDVREAWEEGNLQYASCLLHWRALDYTLRSDHAPGSPGWLAEGDPQRPSEAQELWTFARSRGGHWLLSAIQQI